jgi:hypothetical protein
LDLSLEEAHETGADLKQTIFIEIHLLLKVYESGLLEQLNEAISEELMVDISEFDLNMLH